ncbi:hypothetical protein UFOVP399_37 [uncultured Caudovirales phage]|uniref:Uncharacterized protein n=1 Tax=uncultured Caudovirales phage TaxID=2100421 RepID=A0A6J5M3Z3_9CAUD|nr:hypothetical protein UFOVP399_37 [uncultured Caudovirales phage]
MRLCALALLMVLPSCVSDPNKLRAETVCVQTVKIRSLVDDFGDGPVEGCAKRIETGRMIDARGNVVEAP